jgi:hypothetical protein
VRPTLGKEPAAEDANPVWYLSGDTGIGLATFFYKLSMTSCLQIPYRLTIICLICLAAPLNYAPPLPIAAAIIIASMVTIAILILYHRV